MNCGACSGRSSFIGQRQGGRGKGSRCSETHRTFPASLVTGRLCRPRLRLRKGKVLVISFNRAGKANAIDGPMHLELARVFSDIAMDRETEAVLLTGKGGTFSVGGDAEWLSAMTSEQVDVLFVEAHKMVMDMLEVPQPIVAAVQGMATGLAATLVVFCDVVFIAEDAEIGDPHVAYALVAGDGGAAVWPLLIGLSRAKELLMTGDIISGKEAARIGLVNHAVPDDQVECALPVSTSATGQQTCNTPRHANRPTRLVLTESAVTPLLTLGIAGGLSVYGCRKLCDASSSVRVPATSLPSTSTSRQPTRRTIAHSSPAVRSSDGTCIIGLEDQKMHHAVSIMIVLAGLPCSECEPLQRHVIASA
jgi:enoyl-CoA hydratase/carnithine racemase